MSSQHEQWLESEGQRLLAFASMSAVEGGFGWLDDSGAVDPERGVDLWITCRMTHCFAVAQLRGQAEARALVDHGVGALLGPLHDGDHGGWFAHRGGAEGQVSDKLQYAHAFVILAASSGVAAGNPDARTLLEEALAIHDKRFWDDTAGLGREAFSRDWTRCEEYRGANSTMHAVEAHLAAADVTGRPDLLDRALRMTTAVIDGFARDHGWLLPEHYTQDWRPVLDYNVAAPAHPFRPFGVTVGHLLEWSRLTLDVEAAATAAGIRAPSWALEAAQALYSTAVGAGWGVDGAEGFVYTVDFDRVPVVRERMHWVVAEAIGAAAALWKRTGDGRYARDYAAWWDFAQRRLIDREQGSWHHELGADNLPARTVWAGKPDIYHAYQATLFARAPLSPALAEAARRGLV